MTIGRGWQGSGLGTARGRCRRWHAPPLFTTPGQIAAAYSIEMKTYETKEIPLSRSANPGSKDTSIQAGDALIEPCRTNQIVHFQDEDPSEEGRAGSAPKCSRGHETNGSSQQRHGHRHECRHQVGTKRKRHRRAVPFDGLSH